MNTRTLQILATLVIVAIAAFLHWRGLLFEVTPVVLKWNTETEVDSIGFHVYRADSPDGPFDRVTTDLIPSAGDPFSGSEYSFRDTTVEPNRTYYYQIEDLETSGAFNRYPDTTLVNTTYQPKLITSIPLLLALMLVWLLPKPPARRVGGVA